MRGRAKRFAKIASGNGFPSFMDYVHRYASPLGNMTLASDGRSLIGLWFDKQKHFACNLKEKAKEGDLPIFDEAIRWLDVYFDGGIPDFIPPLAPRGSAFQKEVWDILLTIPYGKTMTYGDVAEILGKRRGFAEMSSQAVGGAIGRNPISLIIPCHRVVGAKEKLVGYAGGLEKKASLLSLERQSE